MMQIDPDYARARPGPHRGTYPGAMALFVTGYAGDADPHPFGTLDLAKEHGRELGDAVKFVLDRPVLMTPLTGRLCAAFTETTIHFGGPTDRASYERAPERSQPGRKRHAQRMIEAIDAASRSGPSIPTPCSARPGRPVDDRRALGRGGGRLRDPPPAGARRRGPTLWVAAYANDVVGLHPLVRVLKEGGYEGGEAFYGSTFPAPLAEDIESIVVKAAHDVGGVCPRDPHVRLRVRRVCFPSHRRRPSMSRPRSTQPIPFARGEGRAVLSPSPLAKGGSGGGRAPSRMRWRRNQPDRKSRQPAASAGHPLPDSFSFATRACRSVSPRDLSFETPSINLPTTSDRDTPLIRPIFTSISSRTSSMVLASAFLATALA